MVGDVQTGLSTVGTPVILQPEFHSTAVKTCSDGGVHRQYSQGMIGEVG